MDEDLVALLAIPVIAWAAYAGLPLLDPPSLRARRRAARPPHPPPPQQGTGRPRAQSEPQAQNQQPPRVQTVRQAAESFAQKAAQRRATRIGH